MIDLHCHLLYGIDDGPDTLEQSLELCHIAVADGITHAIVTPHIHPGRWENTRLSVHKACIDLQQALDKHEIPLQLGFAAEVRLTDCIPDQIARDEIPFLGELDGYKVMLLEFPHGHIIPGSQKLVAWLMNHGIRPMIAHPERNKFVLRDLNAIRPFVEQGCLLQVTAGSVAGQFGEPARERAIELLARGWVTILATDAHSVEWRPPNLSEGRIAASTVVGEEESWELVKHRPWKIAQCKFANV